MSNWTALDTHYASEAVGIRALPKPITWTELQRYSEEVASRATAALIAENARLRGVLPAHPNLKGLAAALRCQHQIDEDGSEVGVSRQAADEAATIVEAIDAARSALSDNPARSANRSEK